MDNPEVSKDYVRQVLHAAATLRVQMKGRLQDIDALTQEAVTRMLDKPRFDVPRLNLVAYMRRLVTNMTIDVARRRNCHARFVRRTNFSRVEESDALGALIKAEESEQLRAAVERLSPRQRLVMRVLLESRCRDEVVRVLGMEKGTVNVLIWRATKQLRRMLAA